MRRVASIAVCLALALPAACTDEMEAISQITKLRVMGVQADPPEIRPGQGTTLRVLFADPKGRGREVSIFWFAVAGMLTPSSDLSQAGELVGVSELQIASAGGDTFVIPFTRPDILDDYLAEGALYLPVTVIVGMCAGGTLPSVDEMIAADDLRNVSDLCQGGEGLSAFKTFRISESGSPNNNPAITDVSFNGALLLEAGADAPGVFTCKDSYGCREGAPIEAFLTEESFETWTEIRFGEETVAEDDPYISWFVTGGEFSVDRSRAADPPGPFKVDWIPPRVGGSFELWAVAHDLRGGVSWKKFLIQAAVPE